MTMPKVGDELPAFERLAGFHAWNRFAAVNEEFIPIHMDDRAGEAAGHTGAIGMGNLQFAYLHALLREWIGDGGRILSVAARFRAPSLRGLRTLVRGRVATVREQAGETIVDLDVWTETENGDLLASGTATVALSPGR